MVRKVSEVFTDDLDGAKATQTISFSVNGGEYERDLSDSNADKFFSRIDRYISHGRRVGGRARRASMSAKGRGSASALEAKFVREWAVAQGIEVSARGRIPEHVMDKYRASS